MPENIIIAHITGAQKRNDMFELQDHTAHNVALVGLLG